MQVFYIYILAVKDFHLTVFRKRFKKEISDNLVHCRPHSYRNCKGLSSFRLAMSEATRHITSIYATFLYYILYLSLRTAESSRGNHIH